ncbi:SusD family protein [Bacteroidales bacterium Barb6]|nr:SusD family protein [Bacteroidales bacterium Barb6]
MIKQLNILLTATLAFSLLSCDENLLETIPNDRISSAIYWQTPNDALLAVNSLYDDLEGTNILSFDALTDIAHTNEPFEIQAYIEQGNYDALNTKIYNQWANAYKGIAAVNFFLENVEGIPFTDESLLKRYKAEARVLRAYQYLKLVPLFGDVPLIKQTQTLEESRRTPRELATVVWDFIDKELEEVSGWLPDSYEAKDKGRITKWAALGLKARAALYAGDYRKAADAAASIIGSGKYSLYPSYANLFLYEAENNQEVLLDKQFIKDLYSNNVFSLLAPYSQKAANSQYVPTKALADLYQTADGKDITDTNSGYDPNHPYDNRDPRLHFSLFLDGDVLSNEVVFHPAPNSGTEDAIGHTYHNSTTGFNIKKYINKEDYANPSNSGINIILLRYAEVLLTYAEAKIELHEIDNTVYEAINLVRNGRVDVKLPSVSTGQSEAALREIVRKERAVELAFEGFRLADIRRWRIAESVLPGNIYGITYVDEDNQRKVVQVVSASRAFNPTRDYLWPIPQKERDLNPNLTQNENW